MLNKKNARRIRAFIGVLCAFVMTLPMFSPTLEDAFAEDGVVRVEIGKELKLTNASLYNDTAMTPVERDGRYGRITSMSSQKNYYYVNVDDKLMYNLPENTPVEVTIEYYDEGTGSFELDYDSHNPQTYLPAGNPIWSNAGIVHLTDSRE
jgi:hypothetical protein